jgi:hypothetical protein
MLDLFWNLYQHSQIADLQRQAGVDKSEVARVGRIGAKEVEERLDRLVLVVHAMWSLVREKTNVTEADLLKRATELDAQDGTVDGRITRPPVPCSKCGAMICRKFNRCLFCGQEYSGGSALDVV